MKITGWIQASDYSSTELGAVSFEHAAHAVLFPEPLGAGRGPF
jgi:hypothetical protein